MKTRHLSPRLDMLVLPIGSFSLFASSHAHAADIMLHDMAIEFFVGEFVPTLLALASAALREPMTWGVICVAALPSLLRRRRSSMRPQRS